MDSFLHTLPATLNNLLADGLTAKIRVWHASYTYISNRTERYMNVVIEILYPAYNEGKHFKLFLVDGTIEHFHQLLAGETDGTLDVEDTDFLLSFEGRRIVMYGPYVSCYAPARDRMPLPLYTLDRVVVSQEIRKQLLGKRYSVSIALLESTNMLIVLADISLRSRISLFTRSLACTPYCALPDDRRVTIRGVPLGEIQTDARVEVEGDLVILKW